MTTAHDIQQTHKLPQPQVDLDAGAFWDGARRNRLMLTRCKDCGHWQHPPLERCSQCSGGLMPAESSSVGVAYSYIVMHHNAIPALASLIPYVLVLAEFEGGCRIVGRLASSETDHLIGRKVKATFEAGADERYPRLVFTLVQDA